MSKTLLAILYSLLIITILSPILTVTEPLNCLFFRDYLYISIALSIFILTALISFWFNPKKFIFNKLDSLILIYFSYNIINFLVFFQLKIREEFIFLILQLILYFVIKHFFSYKKSGYFTSQNYLIVSISVIILIPIIIGVLEYLKIIPQFGIGFIMTGGFLNQGVFANFIGILFPFMFTILLFSDKNSLAIRGLSFVVLLLSLIVLIITTSRSAWIASSISVLFVLLHHKKITEIIRNRFDTKIKKIIVVCTVSVAILLTSIVLYNFKKDSADGRTFIWKICVDMIKEKPLLGNGYSSFHSSYNDHQIAYFKQNPLDIQNKMLAGEGKFAFNDYLETLTETGFIGLILFLIIIIYALTIRVSIIENIQKKGYLIIAAKSSIISLMICSFFSYPLRNAISYTVLFVLIAFISANANPVKQIVVKSKKKQHLLLVLTFIICSYVFYTQITTYINSDRWGEAFRKTETIDISEALETYKILEPEFKNNYLFLFNYGSTLLKVGRFEEGAKVLEEAKKNNTSFDLYLNLGECYEKINKFDKAENCYEDASNLVPHKLTPKFKIFKLYIKTNQVERATKCASDINEMEIKIFTPLAGQIKKEAQEYLNKMQRSSL